MHLNKVALADKIVERVGVSKKQAEDMIEAFQAVVIETLKQGGEVTLAGFGTFLAKYRAARMGVDPQNPTNKMQIPAVTVPKFRAGKRLKDELKHSGGAPEQKPVETTEESEGAVV